VQSRRSPLLRLSGIFPVPAEEGQFQFAFASPLAGCGSAEIGDRRPPLEASEVNDSDRHGDNTIREPVVMNHARGVPGSHETLGVIDVATPQANAPSIGRCSQRAVQ
jgi:hypothetical protein